MTDRHDLDQRAELSSFPETESIPDEPAEIPYPHSYKGKTSRATASTPLTSALSKFNKALNVATDFDSGIPLMNGEKVIDTWHKPTVRFGCCSNGWDEVTLTTKQLWVSRARGLRIIPRFCGFRQLVRSSVRLKDVKRFSIARNRLEWEDIIYCLTAWTFTTSISFAIAGAIIAGGCCEEGSLAYAALACFALGALVAFCMLLYWAYKQRAFIDIGVAGGSSGKQMQVKMEKHDIALDIMLSLRSRQEMMDV